MSKPQAIISPSLLSADFGILGQESQKMLQLGADTLHVDVMDGNFVPNISFGLPAVRAVKKHTENFEYVVQGDTTQTTRKGAFLDCHLMVMEPEKWLPMFAKIGVHGFTFHYESLNSIDASIELLKKIKAFGIRSGIALKPGTPVDVITPELAEYADMVLIMTVEPGFGGQKFMADMMPKVETLRKLYPNLLIQVDGGLDVNTVKTAAEAGANVIVSGSGVFLAEDPAMAIQIMKDAVNNAVEKWNI